MKLRLQLTPDTAAQVEAIAGELFLQLQTVGGRIATVRLNAEQAAAFSDMVCGVACIAEEQAFELDLAVAMAAAGHAPPAPRNLADLAPPDEVASRA